MKLIRTARLFGAGVLAAQLAASSGAVIAPARAQTSRTCTVAPSGAEFSSIQAALNDTTCFTINLTSGNTYREALRIGRNVIIQGTSSDRRATILDGNNAFRPLEVLSSATLTLRNVTIQNGIAAFPGDPFADPSGGALVVNGSAFLDNVTLTGNRSGTIIVNGTLQLDAVELTTQTPDCGINGSSGQKLTITRSTLRATVAGARGLCALNLAFGEWNVTNSTFLGWSLAIDANFTGTGEIATFINNTFANNEAVIAHSGTTPTRFAAQFGNNIFQKSEGSTRSNCSTAIAGWKPINFGNNIDSDGSCGFGPATNALLDQDGLQAWASSRTSPPISTIILQYGSPARNAGDSRLCGIAGNDQLGDARPSTCTIGAVQERTRLLISLDVYEDTNRNGVRDSGETVIANWPVRATYVGAGQAFEVTGATNAFGGFVTSLTSVGQFDMCATQQPGWSITSPGIVSKAGAWCFPAQTIGFNRPALFNFGIARSATGGTPTPAPSGATIRVRSIDTTGAPVTGVSVSVDANGSPFAGPVDAAGQAAFSGLTPGNYRICASKPANRSVVRPQQFDANGNPCYWFTLASGTSVDLPFEWSTVAGGATSTPRPPTATPQPPATSTPVPGGATFNASVFSDANGNGNRDAGEAALSGWRVTVFDQANNDAVARTGLTDASGNLALSGLASGSYRICEDLQAGWVNTRPTSTDSAGRPCYWFSIQSGQSQALQFANRNTGAQPTNTPVPAATATPPPGGSVRFNLSKFNDANANGAQDAGESGLANWQFLVINTSTGAQTSATSNAAGAAVVNVAPGNYKICEVNQTGWRNTRPNVTDDAGRPCYWLTMSANTQTSLSFGNTQAVLARAASADSGQPVQIFVEPLDARAIRTFLPLAVR
jgi:hypothetical protein